MIYHHVTIGSNTLKGSKGYGAPTIEDGVLIGAGAKIIGNITIGKNSRIGAGCVVTERVPENSVVVMPHFRIIRKDSLSNRFVSNDGSLNPNPHIGKHLKSGCQSRYLVDWIHPNADAGIKLFSKGFIHGFSKE